MDELQNILELSFPIIQQKLNFTDSVFAVWFSELSLSELTEEKAVFSTRSKLKQKILTNKYKDVVKEALFEVIGFEVEPVFVFTGEAEEFPAPPTLFEKTYVESEEKKNERAREFGRLVSSESGSVLDGYTFDNFVRGDSNEFALSLCLAVAHEPTTYNPLFIYGDSGLGKTHLLAAIVNYMKKHSPELRIVYKKSEDFINELISAISTGSTVSFKDKYRSADVLLIDDIQFIAGKESTQEEFFHTFSALYESNKQIILTSDRPPREIQPLEDRLRTRFEGACIADVQPPSLELRLAIIRKKSADMGIRLSDDLVNYMAERLHNNIRQIEGVLKRIGALNSVSAEGLSREELERIISVVAPDNVPPDLLVDKIISVVAKKNGIRPEDIKSKKRQDNIAKARHVAIYITRNLTSLPLQTIGQIFNRDHTTIMSSIDKVDLDIKTKKNYHAEILSLIKQIKG